MQSFYSEFLNANTVPSSYVLYGDVEEDDINFDYYDPQEDEEADENADPSFPLKRNFIVCGRAKVPLQDKSVE